jgi:hypothetical protein
MSSIIGFRLLITDYRLFRFLADIQPDVLAGIIVRIQVSRKGSDFFMIGIK